MALRPNDANMSALFYFVRFFVDSETSATMSVRQLCIPYHAPMQPLAGEPQHDSSNKSGSRVAGKLSLMGRGAFRADCCSCAKSVLRMLSNAIVRKNGESLWQKRK